MRILLAVVVWLALLGFGSIDDRKLYPVALAAAVAAALAVVWLCQDAYIVAEPPQWALYHSPAPSRTFDPRFSRLSQELADASDRQAAALAVYTSVAGVADRILRDTYVVDRALDPAAADRILGESISSYLAAGPSRAKNVFSPQLFDVLTRLESL